MADQKISERTLKAVITGNEKVPVGESGDPYITPNQIAALANSGLGFAKIGQVGKSKFDVQGYAIVRMRTNTGTPGGGNLYLTYEIMTPADGHDSHFIYSANPNASTGKVEINYPYMKTVYRGNTDTDDRLKDFKFDIGDGVDVFKMYGYLKFPTSSSALIKLSTVTGSPVAIPGLTPITNIEQTSGVFKITGGAQWYQQAGAIDVKIRIKTGVGIFNMTNDATIGLPYLQFEIRDVTGTKITSFDSNNDGDFIAVTLPYSIQVLDGRYYNPAFWPDDIGFEATAVALFCEVSGEAYLIASPVSSTGVLAEWQAFPSATDYQLYRSLKSAASVDLTTGAITFGTETQVYNGAGFSFADSGLTANTIYYYHLKGTVSGIADTDMTFFDVKTNP